MMSMKKTSGLYCALLAAALLVCAPPVWAQDGPIATAPIPPANPPAPIAPATERPITVPSTSRATAPNAAAAAAEATPPRPKRQVVAAPPVPPKKPQQLAAKPAASARDAAKPDRARQERSRFAVRDGGPAPWPPYQEWADAPRAPPPAAVPPRYYAEQALRSGPYAPSWYDEDQMPERPYPSRRMPPPLPW